MAPPDVIDEAMQLVDAGWTPSRAALGLARIDRALQRRPRRRAVLAVAAVATAAGAAVLLPLRRDSLPAQLSFPDGTTVRATLPATELRVAEDTPTRQVVHIVRGGARFDVAHIEGRTFRVQLRDVAVEVLGTIFRVEQAGDRVRVAVERGRVRILHGTERRELGAGSSVELSPAAAPAPTAPERVAVVKVDPRPAGPATRVASRPAAAARRVAENVAADDDLSAGALLEKADRARGAGRPERAMAPLRMLVARFPEDARAPLAAFTLGLLALDHRRPEEAAQAFALARRLDPGGELAEDALAREVQAWYEAGSESTARDRASEYQRRYPAGRRAGLVRRLGGIR